MIGSFSVECGAVVDFDVDKYQEYLASREVDEEDMGRLNIKITDIGQTMGSSGYYMNECLDGEMIHTIGISPRSSRQRLSPGRILRHETEHYIYSLTYPNHFRRRKQLLVATFLGAAVFGAHETYRLADSILPDFSYAIDEFAGGISASVGAVVAGTFATVPVLMGGKVVGPSELTAVYAEYFRKRQLPDNVLVIK